jgi:hypothetical protein
MGIDFVLVENNTALRCHLEKRLIIILFRLILILLPVFGRCHAGIFLKNITEIMGIVIPCLVGNLGTLVIGCAKEFLSLVEP